MSQGTRFHCPDRKCRMEWVILYTRESIEKFRIDITEHQNKTGHLGKVMIPHFVGDIYRIAKEENPGIDSPPDPE